MVLFPHNTYFASEIYTQLLINANELWCDSITYYVHRFDIGIVLLADTLSEDLNFCMRPKCFFMIIVNISRMEIDELQRWKVFIAIWIASSVKLKSQWADEWAYIFPRASAGQWGCDGLAFTFVIYYSLKSALVTRNYMESSCFSNTLSPVRECARTHTHTWKHDTQVTI